MKSEDQHDEDDGLLFGILQLVVPLLFLHRGTLDEDQHDEDGVDRDGK